MSKTLFIVVNVDWAFLLFRLPVALAALKEGYNVTIITKDTGKKSEIESYGLHFIEVPFDRSGTNPFHEMKCILSLIKLYRKNKPDIIHHVTLKAAILGSIAAKCSGNRAVVNAISGFGYNFTTGRNGLKQKIIRQLMRLAFKSRHFHFILQNPDDVRQISGLHYAPEENIHLIKGSGVNLCQFSQEEEIVKEKIQLVLPSRMLYDKGVIEFIEAAKKIKPRVFDKAEFILVGDCDDINLSGISREKLLTMTDNPYIQWVGFKQNMFQILCDADVVVLPSYREGLPKSLIEATAVGRPVITTDTQGCRECVIEGYNGYLVPVKDTELLSQRMETLINDSETRKGMGKNSRLLAEREFSIEKVIKAHLAIYDAIHNS